jgi:oxalate decarboxylase/phosphoglucose isomerase-like protein (cupin superfamily)
VKIIEREPYEDLRGLLAFAETGDGSLPFIPKRYFVVFGVPSRQYRGEHAHRTLHQLLTCLHGECMLMVDDGVGREEIALHGPGRAVYLPPMVWGVQFNFSPDAVLLVLASDQYDAADYIRDYDEFLRLVKAPAEPPTGHKPPTGTPTDPRRDVL